MPIKLTIGALQDMQFDACLEYISPRAREENGANLFEIKAAITIPDSVYIRSGYSANAEIVLQRSPRVLTVPESCVEFKDGKNYVHVLTGMRPDQVFERRPVTLGISDGIKIEVKEGITADDKVRGTEKTNTL